MQQKKILIVEDDKMISTLISMFVTNMGYEIIGYCQNGEDAILKCRENMPDVILMDIHLKGNLTGIETAKKIHQLFDIPVVYVSSDDENSTVQDAIYNNTYGFLIKPIHKQTLGIIIELAYYKHQFDKELKIKERRNCAVIDVSQNSIIILAENIVEYANYRGLEIFGITKPELFMGQNILNFISENDHQIFIQNITLLSNNFSVRVKKNDDAELFTVQFAAEKITFADKDAIKLTLQTQ